MSTIPTRRPRDERPAARPDRSRLERFWPLPQGPRAPAADRSFWIVTALVTGAGSAAFDALAARSALLAVPLALAALVFGLGRQLGRTSLDLTAYWPAVAAASAVGAMLARGVRALAGALTPLGWVAGACAVAVCALAVLTVLLLWRRGGRGDADGTGPQGSRRREGLLWAGSVAVVALATAVADATAADLGLVHLVPVLVYGAVTWAVLRVDRLRLGAVATFWALFALTRSIGVSGADWLARPMDQGGVNLGEGTVAFLAAVVALVLVAQSVQAERDDAAGPDDAPGP